MKAGRGDESAGRSGGSGGPPLIDSGQYGNRRILIVDDQPEVHDDFSEMLEPTAGGQISDELAMAFLGSERDQPKGTELILPEFELSHAFSGEEAHERIRDAMDAGTPFALAFVDVRMPGMDGIEATGRIREIDRHVEIVIMTAYSDRTLSDIVGVTDLLHKMLYVRKPFSREEIQQIALCLVGKYNVEQALARRSLEIADKNSTLEAVLDATEDAMAMLDSSDRLVFANQRFQRLLGLGPNELDEMDPKGLAARLRERFRAPSAPDVMAGLVVQGRSDLVERVRPGEGGLGLYYRLSSPVSDRGGDSIGRLEVFRDVSKDIEVQRMKAEVLRLRGELERTESFGEMVGGSRKMREVYGLITQAAGSDVTVLICGETGTGKELVAKAFHENSERRDGPFEAVNCGALPDGLIESELFGHEKGAFTGAVRMRRGAFERAQGGTLFLDEIAEMPPAQQVRLLRALEEREFRRVGGSRMLEVDVRVIAATNQDLEEAVKSGRLREDLFYRLSAFPVEIPPLRDRREDIPLLAGHFLARHSSHAGKAITGLSTAAVRLLLEYDWPGNVRELSNAIRRAVLLENGDVLQAGSLPSQLSDAGAPGGRADRPVLSTLAAIERRALKDTLEIAGNNKTLAARHLGINRSTLYRKLKRHGLD